MIELNKNGKAYITDANNSTHGNYTIKITENNKDITKGIIIIKYTEWTKRARLWKNKDERQDTEFVNNFIRDLIKNPIQFELEHNILKIKYLNNLFEFTN